MQNPYYGQVHEGMEVLDTDGQKIGMFGETLGDYFNVDAGFLGTNEYYVPFHAITNIATAEIMHFLVMSPSRHFGGHILPEIRARRSSSPAARRIL